MLLKAMVFASIVKTSKLFYSDRDSRKLDYARRIRKPFLGVTFECSQNHGVDGAGSTETPTKKR